MSISIRPVSEIQFSSVLTDIKTLVRRGLVDPELGTLSKQAQLLTELCMILSPPRSNKDAAGKKISPTHKAAGESAVARDIDYVVKARSLGYLESVIAITGTDTNVRQWLRNKKGQTYLVEVDRVNPAGNEIATWHESRRDFRGRIKPNRGNNDALIGRWRARDRLWVTPDVLAAYRKKKQALVGWAKAGWLKAYIALRGSRIPDWVARHGASRGTFIDGRADQTRPYVQVGNNTGWGQSADAERVIDNAFRARARAMQTYFNTTMRLAAEGKPTQWQAKMAAAANSEAA